MKCASGESALLVGTGLTMVDLVLSLDSAGHQGRIVALSRRGQVPRSHADFEPAPVEADEVPVGNVRSLWRWLRERSARVGWRAAVDSLRPHSHSLWQSLDGEQQRRFLRHARPWWDVHRHRIAPEVAQTVHRLVSEGRLEIVADFRAESLRLAGTTIVVAGRGGDGAPRAIEGIDEIVVAAGGRPDLAIASELRVRLDPWIESTESSRSRTSSVTWWAISCA